MLNAEEIKKFFERGGYSCPFCQSENNDIGCEGDEVATERKRSMECYECGGKWEELFELAGIRTLLAPTDHGVWRVEFEKER